jgi:hypothetical protein
VVAFEVYEIKMLPALGMAAVRGVQVDQLQTVFLFGGQTRGRLLPEVPEVDLLTGFAAGSVFPAHKVVDLTRRPFQREGYGFLGR